MTSRLYYFVYVATPTTYQPIYIGNNNSSEKRQISFVWFHMNTILHIYFIADYVSAENTLHFTVGESITVQLLVSSLTRLDLTN